MTNPRKRLTLLLALLASVLGACSQPETPPAAPPSATVTVEVTALDRANVKSVQLHVSGPDVEQTYVQDVAGAATVSFPVTLSYDDYVFTARGFSAVAAEGVVLYKTSQPLGVGEDSTNLSLSVTRTTSNLSVRVGGVAAGETVVARSSGVSQALVNAGDGTATGTLLSVATGERVSVSAEAADPSGKVVKQGRSITVALSETDQAVSVTLTAVAVGNAVPDSVALALTPSAPVAGSPVALAITATDPDGAADLTTAQIDWLDGSALQTQPLTNGAASLSHTYTVPGSYTVNVSVYDRAGASKSGEVTVEVVSAAPTDTPTDPPTDTTAPTVATALSGATDATGAYTGSATVTVTATDTGGSGLASVSYSLDEGAFQSYRGPVTVSAAGAHTVTARAVDGAGNTTTTPSRSFTVVATPTSLGALELQNSDGVPFNDRLVFSRIGSLSNPPGNGVHDLVTLRLKNTGTETLNVQNLSFGGADALEWRFENAPTLPTPLPAGGQLDLPIRFIAESGRRVHSGSLTVTADDAASPRVVQLAGWWQSVSENNQEPSLQKIVEVFGYKTVITKSGQSLNRQGLFAAVGDEILSPYWRRADSTGPVKVQQLAAFHSYPESASIFWYAKGSGTKNTALSHTGQDAQSLLPHKNSSSLAVASFTPGSDLFGFGVASEFSDWRKNNGQKDLDNGCAGTLPQDCGHHVRFWPVKDRSGNVVANSYLMAMDYAGINYDFNDNVYLISNVSPEAQATYRLNVAGPAYTDTFGNSWLPDSGFYLPSDAKSEGGTVRDIADTDDDTLYRTYRAFLPNKPNVTDRVLVYNLSVPAGDYEVRLHFAELYWDAPGKRVFDVSVEGTTVLDNFDILAETTKFSALVKTFKVHVSDGMLTLRLKTEVDFAALSALEVVPSGTAVTPSPGALSSSPADGATVLFRKSAVAVASVDVNIESPDAGTWFGGATLSTGLVKLLKTAWEAGTPTDMYRFGQVIQVDGGTPA